MVTLAPTACVRSATRKTCRDNREGGDPAPQERKVGRWESHDLKKKSKGVLNMGLLGGEDSYLTWEAFNLLKGVGEQW